jgi:peptide/nickel transport system substrate-binding protein
MSSPGEDDSVFRAFISALSAVAAICVLLLGARPTLTRAGAQPDGQAVALSTNDLLRAAPFDRITLIDESVLLVDPVRPRPLTV